MKAYTWWQSNALTRQSSPFPNIMLSRCPVSFFQPAHTPQSQSVTPTEQVLARLNTVVGLAGVKNHIQALIAQLQLEQVATTRRWAVHSCSLPVVGTAPVPASCLGHVGTLAFCSSGAPIQIFFLCLRNHLDGQSEGGVALAVRFCLLLHFFLALGAF